MSPKTGRVVIPAGQSESSMLQLETETIVGIYMPPAWDAADLAFANSPDGVNFSDMHEFGSLITVQADGGQYVALDFPKFVGVSFLKLKSQSGGAPVNQSAERVLMPVFRTLE